MQQRQLENLDWLFRHYVMFCLLISVGGFGFATIAFIIIVPDASTEVIFWPLLGATLGTVLCLLMGRILKAFFYPTVIARLKANEKHPNA